jgi:hypothetical protein
MANDIHTPDKSGNYSLKDTPPADKLETGPWNKSKMEIEPAPTEGPVQGPQEPKGRFSDKLKISPMNEQGAANKKAVRGWPEGQKKI